MFVRVPLPSGSAFSFSLVRSVQVPFVAVTTFRTGSIPSLVGNCVPGIGTPSISSSVERSSKPCCPLETVCARAAVAVCDFSTL
jgi:hypothetical protein